MTTTERLSGAESAARIIGRSRWEAPECGHGNCAATVECTSPCKLTGAVLNLPVLDTMTDDRFNLHRVDTSQIGERDGVSVGGCRTDLPIQFADNEVSSLIETVKRDAFWLKWGFAAIAGGFLIAAVIHVSTK